MTRGLWNHSIYPSCVTEVTPQAEPRFGPSALVRTGSAIGKSDSRLALVQPMTGCCVAARSRIHRKAPAIAITGEVTRPGK